MSRRTLHLHLSLLVLVVFASLLFAVVPALAQSTPEAVAIALIAAENANDPQAGIALFAPDAVVTLPTGVLDTTEAIAAWQEEFAAGNFHIEAVGLLANGGTASWGGEISLDVFRGMGITSLPATWVITVENGLLAWE